MSFLLNSNCDIYEINYLGLPLKYKLREVKFYDNLQLVIIELPILPSGRIKLNITFKYYSTHNSNLIFSNDSVLLNNFYGFFPFIPTYYTYLAEVHIKMPEGWHIISGCVQDDKVVKYSNQMVTLHGTNKDLSFVFCSSLKTTENLDFGEFNLLYPRPYLNQARTITSLSKEVIKFFTDTFGPLNAKYINIAVVYGNFTPYFDGCNIVFPTSWLDSIKEEGKTPKDREKLIYSSLCMYLSCLWWRNVDFSSLDSLWLVDGFQRYTGLLAIKEKFGMEEYTNLIKDLQSNYLKSEGFIQGIPLDKVPSFSHEQLLSKGYPLNVLIIRVLEFLSKGNFKLLCNDAMRWEGMSWDKLSNYFTENFSEDIKWVSDSYVAKHKVANLNIKRLDVMTNSIKGNLVDLNKAWNGKVEIQLCYADNVETFVWDGISPITLKEELVGLLLDPNLYIPGSLEGKPIPLTSSDKQKKISG